jgi:site-specific DNA recombinase
MLQRGAIQEIRTFEKTYLPSDNVLMIAVELGMANQYVRDLSVNIRRGIREKIRRGLYHGKAPFGYYNEPRLRTIVPNRKTFKKVKAVLEKFAAGKFSLTAIQREFAEAGVVGKQSKKPLTLSSIPKILRNPFYYGVFRQNGELHQGAHLPMITKKTFDEIQTALVAVSKPRHNRRKDKGFLFRNFATCGACGFAITAERHTKKSGLVFLYYRCTHKSKSCRCPERIFVRQEKLGEEIKRNTELLSIPDEWKEKFLARIETWSSESSAEKQKRIDALAIDLALLKSKLDRVNTAFADGSLDIDEFKELKNPLVPQKVELDQKILALETNKYDRLEPLRSWICEANDATHWVAEENWSEMKSFLQRVGSNRLLRAQTLTVSFKKPWDSLAETTRAVRVAADFSQLSARWWSLGDSNP